MKPKLNDLRADAVGRDVRYERLRMDELKQIIVDCPIVYVAVGPMEAHGPQSPVGLDALKAHGICLLAAQRFGGGVYPPLFVGQQGVALSYAGNCYIRPDTAKLLYRDLLTCLERTGFQVIVMVSGHYPEAGLIKAAANEFMVNGMTPVLALIEPEVAGEIMGGGDHGGKWETSEMLALYPDLVQMSALNPDRAVTPPASLGTDPRDATLKAGSQVVALAVKRIGTLAAHLLAQRRKGTVHGALFAQFRRREVEIEQQVGARGQWAAYQRHPLLRQYRDALWAGEFERADRLQNKLATSLFKAAR